MRQKAYSFKSIEISNELKKTIKLIRFVEILERKSLFNKVQALTQLKLTALQKFLEKAYETKLRNT